MSVYKPKISLDVLPQDVLMLKDTQFYELVEKLTSSDVADILQCQAINSINTFLLCKNILESILLPTPAFDAIRRNVCVKLDQNNNGSYAIHIGIHGQFQYLTELFRKKNLEEAKIAQKHRLHSTMNSTSNVAVVPMSTSIPNSTTTFSSTPAIDASAPSSVIDHRSNIVSYVNKWIMGEGKRNGLNTAQMVEGTDFIVELSPFSGNAVVVCKCQTRFSLPKSIGETFSLSNLYKHWKTSKKCNVLTSVLGSNLHPTSPSAPLNDSNINNDSQATTSSISQANARESNKRTASAASQANQTNARESNKRTASATLQANQTNAKRRR